MTVGATEPRFGHETGFAVTKGRKLPFDRSILDDHTRARLELSAVQRKFLAQKRRRETSVHEVIDAMIAYEKVRSGSHWKDEHADPLARRVREAIKSRTGLVDLSGFADRANTGIERVDWPYETTGTAPVPLNGPFYEFVDLNKANNGTYFDKWYEYRGAFHLSWLATFEGLARSMMGGAIEARTLWPGTDDLLRCTAEGGIWFTYTPERSGYVEVILFFERTWDLAVRQAYPSPGTGKTSTLMWVDAVAGIWADRFRGRGYTRLDNFFETLDAGTGDYVEKRNTNSGGIRAASDWRVEKGQPVNVMLGMRAKVATQINEGCGVRLNRTFQARIRAAAVRVVDERPSD